MRIAIIGSGISGIAAAAVLQREGHEVVVFEREAEPGGVWAHTYPKVTLQNTAAQYHLADFPWPFEPDLNPTAEQIRRYLHAAIEYFDLDVRVEHVVERLDELEGRGWKVHGRAPGGAFGDEFEFVLVAVGQYTQPKSSAWQQLPGRERFRGRIVSERDIDDLSIFAGRRVAVVGFGKSAVDLATMAAQAGASSVSHVFRTPRWLIPFYLLGFVHYTFALFTRINTVMIPSWAPPTAAERFLHGPLAPLVRGFWAGLSRAIWLQQSSVAFGRGKPARERIARLRPRQSFLADMRSAAAMAPPDYFRLVAEGRIEPVHAELIGFDETGLRLGPSEGDPAPPELPAEIVVLALGSSSPVFPFLPQRHRDLLEREVDGAQLYRHLIDPRIPNLAFAGYNHGFMHVPSVEVATLWLSAMLRGELELPDHDAMLATIERIREWKRANVGFEPSRSCAVNTRYQQYLDVLLADLGFSPHRKSNPIAEMFARYGASDYAGLVDAMQERRAKQGPLRLRPLPLDT